MSTAGAVVQICFVTKLDRPIPQTHIAVPAAFTAKQLSDLVCQTGALTRCMGKRMMKWFLTDAIKHSYDFFVNGELLRTDLQGLCNPTLVCDLVVLYVSDRA